MAYSEEMSDKEEALISAVEFLRTRTSSIAWRDLGEIIDRIAGTAKLDYWLPVAACQSLTGSPSDAVPASAAILASQASIKLLDDILDNDPKGFHNQIGAGAAANTAMALQALAYHSLSGADIPFGFRTRAIQAMNEMFLSTAYGQSQDMGVLSGEEDYWSLIKFKSMPFYGFALQVGGIIAQGSENQTNDLCELGLVVGAIVQLLDDLYDAFEKPAKPDWNRKTNNILILYALTVDHDAKQEFQELVSDKRNLERLQKLLLESGAVSYCAYQIAIRHDRCRQITSRADIPNPAPIHELLADQLRPLEAILNAAGAEIPSEISGFG